ncbi:stimulus-sensing domain-containing protein [Devosia sp. A8/3-2]|nr:stimulus-sensing domain-containing protein [Devosia sp. A8/3-2]
MQSLRVQGEIIAAAVAASATVDSDVISVNPDRLLELQGDGTVSSLSYFDPSLEFPISPERVAPLLRNLITPTRTRARIYDQGGLMILDSDNIYARGEVMRQIIETKKGDDFFLWHWWNAVLAWVPGDNYPKYREYGVDEGIRYPEVASALAGGSGRFRACRWAEPAGGVGGRAGAACARRGRRHPAVDRAGRYRFHRVAGALGHSAHRHDRGGRADRAVFAAGRHHCRTDAAPVRGR